MPTVDITLTEINPSHSEGSGGGQRSHLHSEVNPTHTQGSGGGRRTLAHTEVAPEHVEGAGGDRRVIVLEEIPSILIIPLPEVATGPATKLGLTEATINGFLEDDGGMLCNCAFEWGLTESYGRVTPTQSKTAGERFTQLLTGLEPDTTYHFKAVASNIFGTSHGTDREFRTRTELPQPYFNPALRLLLEEDA